MSKISEALFYARKENEELRKRLSQAEATIHWVTAEEARKEILSLEARLSHLMDVAGKLSHALGMVMKANHVDVKKPSEECLKEHFVILLPTEDDEEAKLALAEWDGINGGGK